MDNIENKDMIDLGSDPIGEDFDPFASENEDNTDVDAASTSVPQTQESDLTPAPITADATATEQAQVETTTPEPPKASAPAKTTEAKDSNAEDGYSEKLPVFEYAGATENIDDSSKTFDELRIEKAGDFPELEDGKRVSWTVEYGKITKTVPDPKGTSIG